MKYLLDKRGHILLLPLILAVVVVGVAGVAVYNGAHLKKTASQTKLHAAATPSPVTYAHTVSPVPAASVLPAPTPAPTATPSPTPAPPTGNTTGKFSQSGGSWPATQQEVYIGIQVSPADGVSKVEWYLNNDNPSSLYATSSQPAAQGLYQLNWDWASSGYAAGNYRWIVKVYDTNGNYQYALNQQGQKYLDMHVGQ
jgi:hypothetical protein